MDSLIYVDTCLPELEKRIYDELGIKVVRRMNDNDWNINDSMQIICDPSVILAVINDINEMALMEIALLSFMCKTILVTHSAILSYPTVERTISYIDYTSSLKNADSTFIQWFKWWERT